MKRFRGIYNDQFTLRFQHSRSHSSIIKKQHEHIQLVNSEILK